MKKIKTVNNYIIFIDNDDYKSVSKYTWCAVVRKDGIVVAVQSSKRVQGKHPALSRFILNPPKGKVVDHIDGNSLNNQKKNLRICTQAQNMKNRKIHKNNKLGIKGVCYDNGWVSYIQSNLVYYRKRHKTKESAIQWYEDMSKKLHGRYARKTFQAS